MPLNHINNYELIFLLTNKFLIKKRSIYLIMKKFKILSKIKNNSCVVTFLYPKSEKFIKQFVSCLERQTYKKFDVLFFCDNFNLSSLNFKINLNYKCYNVSGTIPQIRQKSIKKLNLLHYKKIFFFVILMIYLNLTE